MPPKKIAAAGEGAATEAGPSSQPLSIKGKVPSDGDNRFFYALIENMVSKPDVNWENVATAMGLKDVKCTKERWRQITKKYELEFPEAPASATKGRGRKPAAANADGDGADSEPATPSKPKNPRGKKAAVTPKSAEIANSEEDELASNGTPGEPHPNTPDAAATPTPVKTPRGRKPGSATKKRASPDGADEDRGNEEGSPPKKKPTPRKPRGPNKKTLAAQAAAANAAAEAAAAEDEDEAEGSKDDVAPAQVDTEMAEADDATKQEATESPLSSVPDPNMDEGAEVV